MKYAATLPFTALFALSLLTVLVHFSLIPPGLEILQFLKQGMGDYFYVMIFLIILLESIVYVGFYFPGQFFAVILVVGASPSAAQVGYLTVAMVLAATLGSLINYALGRQFGRQNEVKQSITLKQLLIAMIHINSLAFFMFAQGSQQRPARIVALAGLLNLPYYLLLIGGTAVLSEQIMAMAENTYALFIAISVWLCIALYFDIKGHRAKVVALD